DVEQILELDELPYACDWIRDYLRTNAKLSRKIGICAIAQEQEAGEMQANHSLPFSQNGISS
ncbi:MAG: hypothetical protein HC833_19995, partial [Leptolyngbyaceae cyanobacterium RM1_406_9]|nr:hypothetical protein [Leptolyngbyaceae cyanobacterium RM1_406_9]